MYEHKLLFPFQSSCNSLVNLFVLEFSVMSLIYVYVHVCEVRVRKIHVLCSCMLEEVICPHMYEQDVWYVWMIELCMDEWFVHEKPTQKP